ncbi:MAG: putative transport system permease protein [Gaiellaceae bacterium]|nr:putative transport system permease protein [Gaiellaceae bacterium]
MQSSEAQAAADSKTTQDDMNVFKYFLLGFGGIALFVGSFVIANTLAITVAQRMRELATLRTLGASRRQVLGSVVMESVIVGIVGSAIGLFLGLGIAVGLMKILEATGIELPQESLVFAPRTIVVSLAVGTLIALLASLRPALKATRVEPISAVREGAVLPASRLARFQLAAAGFFGTASIGLLAYGLFASGLEITVRLAALIVGVLFLFVGVAMVATRVVRPLAYVLGAPGARFGGTAGRLARQNAVRNPSRTASTAAAVMIGIALITFVAVIGQGFRSSFSDSVNELFVADYALTSTDKTADLPGEAVTALATAPGVDAISQIRSGEARLNGEKVSLNGVDGNMPKVLKITWANGSDSVPAKLGATGAVITKAYAEDHALRVGSPLAVQTEAGKDLRLQVHGIIDEAKGGSPIGGVSVALETYDSVFTDHANAMVFINVDGEPSAAKTEALESRLGAFPDAKV